MNSHQQSNTQVGPGLTRYRSAPSSYFAGLLSTPAGDGGFGADDFEQLFNPRASSPETQMIFSRFMNSSTADPPPITPPPPLPPPPQKLEPEEYLHPQQSNDYSPAPPQAVYSEAATDTKVFAPFNPSSGAPNKIQRSGGGGGGGLIRHTSSPAGFFANINIENGTFLTLNPLSSYSQFRNSAEKWDTINSRFHFYFLFSEKKSGLEMFEHNHRVQNNEKRGKLQR